MSANFVKMLVFVDIEIAPYLYQMRLKYSAMGCGIINILWMLLIVSFTW